VIVQRERREQDYANVLVEFHVVSPAAEKTRVPTSIGTQSIMTVLPADDWQQNADAIHRCSICVLLHACSHQPTTGACFTDERTYFSP